MAELTTKDLTAFEELLTAEQNCIEKMKYFAGVTKDSGIKQLCSDAAARHQKHFDTILKEVK